MNTFSTDQDNLSSLTFDDIYHLLLRKLWVIILCFLTVFIGAVGYLNIATPLYESIATLQVETKEERSFTTTDQQQQDLRGAEILNTIVDKLQLPVLFEQVVSRPEIGKSPLFPPEPLPQGSKLGDTQQKAMLLSRYTSVSLRRGSRLIDVSVLHQSPEMAKLIAAAIVDEYLKQTNMSQLGTTEQTGSFLIQQAKTIKADLQMAEDGLQLYQNSVLLRNRIRDQQKIVDTLKQRYRDKHPKMIQANTLFTDLLNQFDASIQSIRAASPAENDYWKQGEATSANLTGNDRILNEVKLVESRQILLTQDEATQSALFETVNKQMHEATVNKEQTPTQVTLANPAELPLTPAKPKKLLILILASLGGVAFGIISVFGIYFLDSSFHTVDETERFLELPVLSVVPDIGGKAHLRRRNEKAPLKPEDKGKQIELIKHPGSSASEGLRSLRATLGLMGTEEHRKSVLFTSALASEGKTFITSNYAVALAQQGLKTLLIDADLRRPTVHERFQLSNRGRGLVELVVNELPMKDVVHSDYVPNLDILLTGNRCPNPSEFLASKGFADVLAFALQKYDRVVIDSAPINAVSDTMLIVPHIQAVCLVIRCARTSRRAIRRAIYNLKMAHSKPLGVVLNRMPRRLGGGYGSYYYYYQTSDKYGEVYGSKS